MWIWRNRKTVQSIRIRDILLTYPKSNNSDNGKHGMKKKCNLTCIITRFDSCYTADYKTPSDDGCAYLSHDHNHPKLPFPSGRWLQRSRLPHILPHGCRNRRQKLTSAVDPVFKVWYSCAILVMPCSSTINSRCCWPMQVNGTMFCAICCLGTNDSMGPECKIAWWSGVGDCADLPLLGDCADLPLLVIRTASHVLEISRMRC